MVTLIIIWDCIVNVLWTTFSVWTADEIGWLPLVFNFLYYFFLFLVVYDLRHKQNMLQLTDCYNYLRLLGGIIFVVLAFTSFALMLVFLNSPEKETRNFTAKWMIFYLNLTVLLAIIQFATAYKLRQAIRVLRSTTFYDIKKDRLSSSFDGLPTTRVPGPMHMSQLEKSLALREAKL